MAGDGLDYDPKKVNLIPDLEPEIGDKDVDEEASRIPCSLIVRNVPIEVFQDDSVKAEFTDKITQYATPRNTIYLKSFRRVRFDFSSPSEAYHVRTRLSMFEFHAVR